MRLSASVLVVLALLPAAAHGQSAPAPLARLDVAAATGWFAADRSVGDGCCSSWSSSLFKGVSGGYYWTDHLKTEVELAAPGPTDGYTVLSERLANGFYRYTSEEHTITAQRLSLSQAYQFGRNTIFHPFVRGGFDIDREHDDIDRYISSNSSQREEHSEATGTRVRPFTGVGFKAYFSERAFFRGEARFNLGRSQLNQMAWTAGVGVDLAGRRRSLTPGTLTEAKSDEPPRGQEPADVWRSYASRLPLGSIVDVAVAGGARFTATLLSADDSGIVVVPSVRIAEPGRRIAFDGLEVLALHGGAAPGRRAGAVVAGAGAGAGTFFVLILAALAAWGD